MYLRSIRIENYRAVREGWISLDKTTVLIGENDCGRSSVIEALMLVLGSRGETFESRLRPFHFHRRPDGTTGPLRVILHLVEDTPGSWSPPGSVQQAFPAGSSRRLELDFELRAVLDGLTEGISTCCYLRVSRDGDSIPCGDEVLTWLREMIPALWLRSGLLSPASEQETDKPAPDPAATDPALAALELHYRNLVTGNAPDLAAELEMGARAAQDVMDKYQRLFATSVPMMSAMASDVLRRRELSSAAINPQTHTAAHRIGVLLLLGSILRLSRRSLAPQGKPILVIENPESNLHPITLANVWRTIERLTWQKIIATNSGTLLGNAPLASIRRLTRGDGKISEWSVQPRLLSREDLRRVSYHLRSRRSPAMFARCWLLVEGETEYWMIPELARVCGFDFSTEGVACVEFAQCGLPPLTKLADSLGIAWHVLVDGDEAGERYAETVRSLLATRPRQDRTGKVTKLRERDIEHHFWSSGFADVIQRLARADAAARRTPASVMIRKAIEKTSKPFLALSLIDAAADRGPKAVPPVLRGLIESSIAMARSSPASRSQQAP